MRTITALTIAFAFAVYAAKWWPAPDTGSAPVRGHSPCGCGGMKTERVNV